MLHLTGLNAYVLVAQTIGKDKKEIAELHPDFGKGKDCKIWIDEI